MNLSPTDRDKLQAYLDALEAVPIPQIVDTALQPIAASVAYLLRGIIDQDERELK